MLACAFYLCLLQAVFKVVGSNKRFPVVKDSYVTDENDMAKRSVLDGDSFLPGASPSWRFRSPEVEPYMTSQGKGLPWFSVNKVSVARDAGLSF
jgi:ATP-dependent Clp protease protease subunit